MERALIIGVNINKSASAFELAMNEMSSLAEACGMEVAGRIEQNMERANTATYIGSGKVVEAREMADALETDIIIFDNGLTPVQLRNLQNELDYPVMDRTTLILEIFSSRAKTREAKQVCHLPEHPRPPLQRGGDERCHARGGDGFRRHLQGLRPRRAAPLDPNRADAPPELRISGFRPPGDL